MKILFLVGSYLVGAFPSGYLFFWISEKKDIRSFGSGTTGATNFLRLKGLPMALTVAVIDVLKGALPVYLALRLFPETEVVFLSGFLAVIGHCYPVYLRFRGGKGVATAVGVFVVLAYKPLLLMIATFILVIAITRYVSLGSLLAGLLFPLYSFLLKSEREVIFLGIALFLVVALRHGGNIKRLLAGNERKLGEKIR